ncbi:MAG: hypothetical protein AAF466_05375 [Bacteroidota bacterium]
MKTYLATFLAICFLSLSAVAQNSCSKFYPFSEGASTQLSMYDKKGKLTGVVEHTVGAVTATDDGDLAVMNQKLIDDKGNLITTSDYNILCKEGLVSIDFNSLSRPEMMQAFQNAETEVTGTNIDLPNDLSVGQELPDGGINIAINMSGINMNMNIDIINRKVEGKETITTPAGTFDCFIITSTTEMKMGTRMTRHSKQWIAEGVGVVKMEDYKKNGKLDGMGMLTSFSE